MSTPNWPAHLATEADLVTYLQNARPLALSQAIFGVDFHEPLEQRRDCTAYTQDNETPFETTIVGRVSQKVTFSYGHRTLRLSTGEPGSDLDRVFTEQLGLLSDAMEHDDYPLNWAIHFPTDTSPPAVAAASYLELHVDHDSTRKCTVYTGNTGLDMAVPCTADVFPIREGDWIIGVVSLHRCDSALNDDRAYKILARHVRVLKLAVPVSPPSDSSTLEAPDDVSEADSVIPGVIVETPETAQKRKAESPMVAGGSKKVRRSPRLGV
ncbi:hypothetical protein C8J57DRAFT_1249899 [Mycena rebaudengoi]|nr:hypothetical protein C8J57DRAFT_1249899 [Mycena rebaudengoi]